MVIDVDLLELERQGWQALAEGRGGAYYREHLADDALMAFTFGVMDRQSAVEAMESAPPWASFEMLEPHVIELTEDCGVVVYGVAAQRAGEEPYSALISSVFVRRDGQWLLAYHQQTPK